MKLHHPEIYEARYREGLRAAEKAIETGDMDYYGGEAFFDSIRVHTPPAVYLRPYLQRMLANSSNPASYLLLKEDPKLQDIYTRLVESVVSIGGKPKDVAEEMMTAIKYAHSSLVWEFYGGRIYEVHPDLAWALQRTELQDFPTADLHLPCTAIYLELPGTLEIPNRLTGTHPCIGAFIMEELLDDARIWRIVLIGGPSGSAESQAYMDTFGYDDAIFHYWIELEKHTAQECIDEQLAQSLEAVVKPFHWQGKKYESSHPKAAMSAKDFVAFKETMTATFRYVMNCVIYATTAESDVWFYEASKEYRDLKDRAMRARGEKRKRLFSELKNKTSHTRYVMGSKTVIDRKRTKEASADGEGRKLTKGGLVAGHWQRYWVGEGRKTCVRKLRLPFWRGPGEEVVRADEGRHVTRLK